MFMGNYVKQTSAVIVPMVEDTPDLIQQSVINSIVNGTSIDEDLMVNMTMNLKVRWIFTMTLQKIII